MCVCVRVCVCACVRVCVLNVHACMYNTCVKLYMMYTHKKVEVAVVH